MKVERMQTPSAGEVVAIELTCPDFDNEGIGVRFPNHCSPGCGEADLKLFVSPRLHGSTIHAYVCSGRYEFVKSLSREWWARKAAPVLNWDEDQIKVQVDPVWAARVKHGGKVHALNNSTRPGCIECGKSVKSGIQLCDTCADAKTDMTKDYGSLDDL